jgi:hypothetical protein
MKKHVRPEIKVIDRRKPKVIEAQDIFDLDLLPKKLFFSFLKPFNDK